MMREENLAGSVDKLKQIEEVDGEEDFGDDQYVLPRRGRNRNAGSRNISAEGFFKGNPNDKNTGDQMISTFHNGIEDEEPVVL